MDFAFPNRKTSEKQGLCPPHPCRYVASFRACKACLFLFVTLTYLETCYRYGIRLGIVLGYIDGWTQMAKETWDCSSHSLFSEYPFISPVFDMKQWCFLSPFQLLLAKLLSLSPKVWNLHCLKKRKKQSGLVGLLLTKPGHFWEQK